MKIVRVKKFYENLIFFAKVKIKKNKKDNKKKKRKKKEIMIITFYFYIIFLNNYHLSTIEKYTYI